MRPYSPLHIHYGLTSNHLPQRRDCYIRPVVRNSSVKCIKIPSTGFSGTLLHHWECHSRYLTTCAFHRHKQKLLLATGSNDKNVKIWHINIASEEADGGTASDTTKRVTPSAPSVGESTYSIASSSSFDVRSHSTGNQSSETKSVVLEFASDISKSKKSVKISDWTVDQVCEWLTNLLELKV